MPVKTTIIYEKHILHKNVVRFQKKKKTERRQEQKILKQELTKINFKVTKRQHSE